MKTECTEFEECACLNLSPKEMMEASNTNFVLAVCESSWRLPESGIQPEMTDSYSYISTFQTR